MIANITYTECHPTLPLAVDRFEGFMNLQLTVLPTMNIWNAQTWVCVIGPRASVRAGRGLKGQLVNACRVRVKRRLIFLAAVEDAASRLGSFPSTGEMQWVIL